jgi:hypothetical protein
VPLEAYAVKFIELVVAPFKRFEVVWLGMVPLYAAVVFGEFSRGKISFRHAIVSGLVMLWAGANWAMYLSGLSKFSYVFSSKALPWIVTACCIGLGTFTVVLGFRQKDRALCQILGRPLFVGYFLILFYPMQVELVKWNSRSATAALIFAVPVWILVYLIGRLLKAWIK